MMTTRSLGFAIQDGFNVIPLANGKNVLDLTNESSDSPLLRLIPDECGVYIIGGYEFIEYSYKLSPVIYIGKTDRNFKQRLKEHINWVNWASRSKANYKSSPQKYQFMSDMGMRVCFLRNNYTKCSTIEIFERKVITNFCEHFGDKPIGNKVNPVFAGKYNQWR